MRLPIAILPCAILLASGLLCGWLITSTIDRATPSKPTAEQHAAAVSAGWIPDTDGYFRFIFGPDAY